MITNIKFVEECKKLIGIPYTEVDCIAVVRLALNIRCEGTNWLWNSIDNTSKYRYITERAELSDIEYLQDGELLFKKTGDDVHHVGIVCNNGTSILHSSPGVGVRIQTLERSSWQLWARIGKFVQYNGNQIKEDDEVPALKSEIIYEIVEVLRKHGVI